MRRPLLHRGPARSRLPRIALVTDAIFPFHRGGKEVRYHEVGRRLALTTDVKVYTMRWWGHSGTWRNEKVVHEAISPLVPLYTSNRRSITQALVFALCTVKLLVRRFDAIEADHMPYVQLLPLWAVARIRRKRFVVTWHEVWGPEAWHDYIGPLGRFAWGLERLAMRLPDEIVAASVETAHRLERYVPASTRLTVAPNGVDLDLARSVVPHADRVDIVVVGRFLPHKRLDLVLETVAWLRRTGHDVTCRVIGDGPGRDSLVAMATDLRIVDFVDFRHDVDDQRDLYALLASGRVFLFPSEREGFGIAVLEALACGLRVVTTTAPDNLAQALVTRSGMGEICEPSTIALADAVVRQLALSRDVSAPTPSREWLEEYDWATVAAKVREACLR